MLNNALLKSMDEMYKAISIGGTFKARVMITPDGVFSVSDTGVLTVYDYDRIGNWYPLNEAEQRRRIALTKARFGI